MEQSEQNDAMLIKGYLAGNPGDFNILYERYRRPLYAYLNRMFNDRARADDVFQVTWIKAIEQLASYEHRQTFLAWLIRIGHNAAIDEFRRLSRREQVELPPDEDGELPEGVSKEASPWEKMQNRELAEALSEALKQLSPELREVFLLRKEDVPFKEIAAIQKCSINTVLARMQYALKNLRKLLADWNQ